jgi:hypothetical protein
MPLLTGGGAEERKNGDNTDIYMSRARGRPNPGRGGPLAEADRFGPDIPTLPRRS